MIVSRAVFHSLIVKDKSSFTVTNGADPVGLIHSYRTMAFWLRELRWPMAIVNDVVVSAPVVKVRLH